MDIVVKVRAYLNGTLLQRDDEITDSNGKKHKFQSVTGRNKLYVKPMDDTSTFGREYFAHIFPGVEIRIEEE